MRIFVAPIKTGPTVQHSPDLHQLHWQPSAYGTKCISFVLITEATHNSSGSAKKVDAQGVAPCKYGSHRMKQFMWNFLASSYWHIEFSWLDRLHPHSFPTTLFCVQTGVSMNRWFHFSFVNFRAKSVPPNLVWVTELLTSITRWWNTLILGTLMFSDSHCQEKSAVN